MKRRATNRTTKKTNQLQTAKPNQVEKILKRVKSIYLEYLNSFQGGIIKPTDLERPVFVWEQYWRWPTTENLIMMWQVGIKHESERGHLFVFAERNGWKPKSPYEVRYVLYEFDGYYSPIYDTTGGTVYSLKDGKREPVKGVIGRDSHVRLPVEAFDKVTNFNATIAELERKLAMLPKSGETQSIPMTEDERREMQAEYDDKNPAPKDNPGTPGENLGGAYPGSLGSGPGPEDY
jgi:hypothetical protein